MSFDIDLIAEEVPTLATKRLTDTSEEYLKWRFSKEKEPKNGDKRGLYFEYRELPLDQPLVRICDMEVIIFNKCNFFILDKFLNGQNVAIFIL